jgi:hypothetical protein
MSPKENHRHKENPDSNEDPPGGPSNDNSPRASDQWHQTERQRQPIHPAQGAKVVHGTIMAADCVTRTRWRPTAPTTRQTSRVVPWMLVL